MNDMALGATEDVKLTSNRSRDAFRLFTKRMIDVCAASVTLMLISPLLVIAGIAVWLEDRGPILFQQTRVGLDGKPFNLLKIRTLLLHPSPERKISQVYVDDPLVMRSGRILRRLKIDELPQLINVLRGDMSLVGPRPTVPEQVIHYNDFQRLRLRVRPGMTGWAQINGNIQLTWDDRIDLDVWYIDHWSLTRDFLIMIQTLKVLFRGEEAHPHNLTLARNYARRIDRGR